MALDPAVARGEVVGDIPKRGEGTGAKVCDPG